MSYEVVLFDLDGTLIDSRHDLAVAVNRMRSHYDLEMLSLEQVVSFVGDGMTKMVERAIDGEDIALADAVAVTMDYYSGHLVDKSRFYDGVQDMLGLLKKSGVKMAVTSNKPEELCREILQLMNADHFFDAIYGARADYALKPAPDMLQLAAVELGSGAERSIVVGDNWTDLEAGRRAGSFTCFHTQGMGRKRDAEWDFSFCSFPELCTLLAEKIPALG